MSSHVSHLSGEGAQPPHVFLMRRCRICTENISEARLRAVPSANTCVSCLEGIGDVPLIRRYDGVVGEDVFETYFTRNPMIEGELRRFNAPGSIEDRFYELAVGDDSFATLPCSGIVGTDGLPSAFESETEDIVADAELLLAA